MVDDLNVQLLGDVLFCIDYLQFISLLYSDLFLLYSA